VDILSTILVFFQCTVTPIDVCVISPGSVVTRHRLLIFTHSILKYNG